MANNPGYDASRPPTSLHFSTPAEGMRHHEAREAWMIHTRRCDIGDEPGAEFFCPTCIHLNDAMQVAMGADRERERIFAHIEARAILLFADLDTREDSDPAFHILNARLHEARILLKQIERGDHV